MTDGFDNFDPDERADEYYDEDEYSEEFDNEDDLDPYEEAEEYRDVFSESDSELRILGHHSPVVLQQVNPIVPPSIDTSDLVRGNGGTSIIIQAAGKSYTLFDVLTKDPMGFHATVLPDPTNLAVPLGAALGLEFGFSGTFGLSASVEIGRGISFNIPGNRVRGYIIGGALTVGLSYRGFITAGTGHIKSEILIDNREAPLGVGAAITYNLLPFTQSVRFRCSDHRVADVFIEFLTNAAVVLHGFQQGPGQMLPAERVPGTATQVRVTNLGGAIAQALTQMVVEF